MGLFTRTRLGLAVFACCASVIRGDARANTLTGGDNVNDVFDADAGGDDILRGRGGGDIYHLGSGTGVDTVQEYWRNKGRGDDVDVILIEAGFSQSQVKITRVGNNLHVSLLAADTGKLVVVNHFSRDKAAIERVQFSDGAVWDSADIFARAKKYTKHSVEIRPRTRDGWIVAAGAGEGLHGNGEANVFSSGRGAHRLFGYGGGDTYRLTMTSGDDRVEEYYANVTADGEDVIEIGAGIDLSRVALSIGGDDLLVELLDAAGLATANSLRVVGYQTSASAKIEKIRFADGTIWGAEDIVALAKPESGQPVGARHGGAGIDSFGGDGGDERLFGYGGDDIYILGANSGDDRIEEYYGNGGGDGGDVIRISGNVSVSRVRVRQIDGKHLRVEVTNDNGDLSGGSMTVVNYYVHESAKIERVEFLDSERTKWNRADFEALAMTPAVLSDDGEIEGTASGDILHGTENAVDIFDSAGNDRFFGYSGDDIYRLGVGDGWSTVEENYGGGGDDTIEIKAGIVASEVRLHRGGEENEAILFVDVWQNGRWTGDRLEVKGHYLTAAARIENIVFADGAKWGAEEMNAARIRGTMTRNEGLYGVKDFADVFDSDGGGGGTGDNGDGLYGQSGDDIYYLGRGTGFDLVNESYGNDVDGDDGDAIRIKDFVDAQGIGVRITSDSVRLRRRGSSLLVELLDADGVPRDCLDIYHYYSNDSATVEYLIFSDGEVWGEKEFAGAHLSGGRGDDDVQGSGFSDVFDGAAGGDDTLFGRSGNDVYRLGAGTGLDTINEHRGNSGDDSDVINIKSGIALSRLRVWRRGDDLRVDIQDDAGEWSGDGFIVDNHFVDASARVERIEFTDGGFWLSADDFIGREKIELTDAGGDANNFVTANSRNVLSGGDGDDVYYAGQGKVRLEEIAGDDTIRLLAGILPSQVKLSLYSYDGGGHVLHVDVYGDDGKWSGDGVRIESRNGKTVGRIEFADGTVWDAAALAMAPLRGFDGGDEIKGGAGVDIFDTDLAEDGSGERNGILRGYFGDDIYWLGRGTAMDTIQEYKGNGDEGGSGGDVIKIKAGIDASRVDFYRRGDNLHVQLLNEDGRRTNDMFIVENYYSDSRAKIEKVELSDGTVLKTVAELDALSISDKYGEGTLYPFTGASTKKELVRVTGNELTDVFDSGRYEMTELYGLGGNDIYWLGEDTGAITVIERGENNLAPNDAADKVLIKSNVALSQVKASRSGNDLVFKIVADGDDGDGDALSTMTVSGHYSGARAKVERVEFDGAGWWWTAEEFVALGDASLVSSTHDSFYGGGGDDIFDNNDGRRKHFSGRRGDDTYWLGMGTGASTVREYNGNTGAGDDGDVIRIKTGIAASQVRIYRRDNDLFVGIDDEDGRPTFDFLTVRNHFSDAKAKIERVEFADGTVWNAGDAALFDGSPADSIDGGAGDETLAGTAGDDVFDGDGGGRDILQGGLGDDIYWLGAGSGADTIEDTGGALDVIKIKAGIELSRLDIYRRNNHLYVDIHDKNGHWLGDRLIVKNHYTDAAARVERIEFHDSGLWWTAEEMVEQTIAVIFNGGYGKGGAGKDFFDGGGKGYGGDDVYYFGFGNSEINEIDELESSSPGQRRTSGDDGDVIRLKAGITASQVRLSEKYDDLMVEYFNDDGVAVGINTLFVDNYYRHKSIKSDAPKIERIEFFDGTVWDEVDIAAIVDGKFSGDEIGLTPIRGGVGDDILTGTANARDVFSDTLGGDDILRGQSGDDVYVLKTGVGHERIQEYDGNDADGDDGDIIRLGGGVAISRVRLQKRDHHLAVQLLDEAGNVSDSVLVVYHYLDAAAKVERIETDNQVLMMNQYDNLIAAVAAFESGTSNFADRAALLDAHWQDLDHFAGGG